MPRNYYQCPHCNWQLSWAFTPNKEQFCGRCGHEHVPCQPDMGLVIGHHIELTHPEMLYTLVPLSVAHKLLSLSVRQGSRQ